MIADHEVVCTGSSNMDMRSFGLNYEITLMSAEGSLLEKMTALAGEYREACRTHLRGVGHAGEEPPLHR